MQCIGVSLLLLIGLYIIIFTFKKEIFRQTLLILGLVIFLIQPVDTSVLIGLLPEILANYITNKNGSVFTLLPWFGYVCFGGYLATLLLEYAKHKHFYKHAITTLFLSGILLVFISSDLLTLIYEVTNIELFRLVASNNFGFIRLGNVLIIFSIFMYARNYLTNPFITYIGGKTLSIYCVHFFLLYGSWFGIGLNKFFYRSLDPIEIGIGIPLFIVSVYFTVRFYYQNEEYFKLYISRSKNLLFQKIKKKQVVTMLTNIKNRYPNFLYKVR